MQTASVYPSTEKEWRLALLAVHPESQTPDAERFKVLNSARDEWRKSQPQFCARCSKPLPLKARPEQKYCSIHCNAKAAADSRRKQKQLRTKSHQPTKTMDWAYKDVLTGHFLPKGR